jgi:NADPH:quinone reductase
MQPGAYAEYAAVPAWKLVNVPAEVTFEQAAATMLQGMTAHYLVTSVHPLKAGETALIHAAAGGVGLLLIQLAKRLGARAIGTVSTEVKAALAREAGADEVIRYTEQDFEQETRRLTGGRGVAVVYDSVGRDTFLKSLNCLAPRGLLALFGQSSGPVEAFDPALLAQKGSLFLTRPSLARGRVVHLDCGWRFEAADRAEFPAGRRRRSTPATGGTQDDGQGLVDSVEQFGWLGSETQAEC